MTDKHIQDKAKSIAIMQPYFFPYLGYFQLIKAVDVFVIYDDVNYINKGFINRNFILLNGQAHKITLALMGASQNRLINEIKIADNATKILKTIEAVYKKAPFFNDIFPILKNIFLYNEKSLVGFIGHSLQVVAHSLNLTTTFLYSSQVEKDNAVRAEHKIIEICKRLQGTIYVNSIGGKKLYDKYSFEQHNIKLHFLQSQGQEYKQFKNKFVPNLSIIDVLMFNDRQQVIKMLQQYELA